MKSTFKVNTCNLPSRMQFDLGDEANARLKELSPFSKMRNERKKAVEGKKRKDEDARLKAEAEEVRKNAEERRKNAEERRKKAEEDKKRKDLIITNTNKQANISNNNKPKQNLIPGTYKEIL